MPRRLRTPPASVYRADWPVRVLGTGARLPERAVASEELDHLHGRPAGATAGRSGVSGRRYADPEAEPASALAAGAVGDALAGAGLSVADLDRLISTAAVGEQPMPTDAALVLERLGPAADGIVAFDVDGSCVGFLHGLEIAAQALALGTARTVAVVAAELASQGLDHDDLESSALFGDGAAAVVLSREEAGGSGALVALGFETRAAGAHLCEIRAGGTRWNRGTPPPAAADYLFSMDGPAVFRLAARTLPPFVERLLEAAEVTRDDVDVVVPHQASRLGLRFLVERLGFPAERVVDLLATHGNQVAASLPTALHAAVVSGRLRRGGLALLLGTAAGFSLAGAILRY